MKFIEYSERDIDFAANDDAPQFDALSQAAATPLFGVKNEEVTARHVARKLDFSPTPRLVQAIETPASITEIELSAVRENARARQPREIKTGVSWAALGGGLAALGWLAAAIGAPVSYYGLEALMTLEPALQGGFLALAFGPAVLFWLAANAAGEAFRARRLASALTDLAREQTQGSGTELVAKRAKEDVVELERAVEHALTRLGDLEAATQRNAAAFNAAIAASRGNAEYMAGVIAREREALVGLNGELRGQTDTMANTIGRQVRLIREAASTTRRDLEAAEETLASQAARIDETSSLMAERTADLRTAAADAHCVNTALGATIGDMLEGLGETTRLSDTARQCAVEAREAAGETATAVRETTQRAVSEAKRAAEAIRAEAAAMREAAEDTLSRLAEAAQAAREASDQSQAAADRHATSIERRLASLAATAKAPGKSAPRAPAPSAPEPLAMAHASFDADDERLEDLYDAAAAAARKAQSAPRGGWTSILAGAEPMLDERSARAPMREDGLDLVEFGAARQRPDEALRNSMLGMVRKSGVDLHDAFRASDLDVIAARSREGASARRRAVFAAAPASVKRMARHLRQDASARELAVEFRARPELAKADRSAQGADLVRAYLLIDTALS